MSDKLKALQLPESTDELVALILSAPPSQQLVQLIKKLTKSDNSDALEAIYKGATTGKLGLGYLHFLLARIVATQADPASTRPNFERLVAFTAKADLQEIALQPEIITHACAWLFHLSVQLRQTHIAAQHLSGIVTYYARLKPDFSVHHLSPAHAPFARACLASRYYEPIIRMLLIPITDFDGLDPQPVSCRDYLEWHYYGGCILAACRYYKEAIAMFEMAATVPGNVASAISLDAYKKYILVSLLSKGKVPKLPKFTSQAVTSAFKNLCGVYSDFQSHFELFERAKLTELVSKHQDTFAKDQNSGLVMLCMRRLRLEAILRLKRTYITASIVEVAAAIENHADPTDLQLQAAQADILQLIASKEIFAEISGANVKKAVVTFLEDPEPYNSAETVALVNRKINEAAHLCEYVQWTDSNMAGSRDYILKALNSNANMGSSIMPEEDLMFGSTMLEDD